jgi:hypothetical protein
MGQWEWMQKWTDPANPPHFHVVDKDDRVLLCMTEEPEVEFVLFPHGYCPEREKTSGHGETGQTRES